MKKLAVYWRGSPADLAVLDGVEHVKVGLDMDEVITTNQGAQTITRLSREPEAPIVVDAAQDIQPMEAVAQIRRWLSSGQTPDALRTLVEMVATEDQAAAQALRQEL